MTDRKREQARERMRRMRERRKAGKFCFTIQADAFELADALEEAGLIGFVDGTSKEDRRALEAALEAALEKLMRRGYA